MPEQNQDNQVFGYQLLLDLYGCKKGVCDDLSLCYKFLDDMIIHELAKTAEVSTDLIISIERDAGSKISKFISSLISTNYMERMVGDKGYINETKYFNLLQDVIIKFAENDNVVLMGRGGQYILKDFKTAYHFFLIADIENRIEFMQRYYKMSTAEAKKAIKLGEDRRMTFFKRFGKENYNDPKLYHLVLNMSRLSIEQAIDKICHLVNQ